MSRNDPLLSRRGLLGGGAAAIAVLALKPSVARAGSRLILVGHRSFVDAAVFSPDGESIVTASWDGTARLWDAATGAGIAVLEGHKDIVKHAGFGPDGRRIVTASDDGTARLWDARTGAAVSVLGGHT